MKGSRSWFKPGHILAAGGALALMLAACSPAAVTPTGASPLGTEPSGLPSAVATEAVSTEALSPTSAATEASTSAATKIATTAATEMATTAATEMATSAAAANQPLLIQADKLLGMALEDSSGQTLGQITDVLVDITGTVHGVVINLSATGAGTPAATSAATAAATSAATAAPGTAVVGTQTSASGVIVPWTDVMADATNQRLTYQGGTSALHSLPAFDASKFSNGYVIRTTGSSLPAEYDGLIRLGAALSNLKLQTATNDSVGSLQDVILDMNAGKATYAAVDVSSFLGATNDVVLVPWTMFKLDATDQTSMTPIVRLDVTKNSLQNAPKFDASTLSFWPTPALPTWDNAIKLFWQSAG